MRAPTENQYRSLLSLGSASAGLSWSKRKTEPFLRRGWVTAEWEAPFYQWVRITAEGLRALAEGVERYGLPELGPHASRARVCSNCKSTMRACANCGCRSYRWETLEAFQ
jgi:hypothetical protein